MRIAAIALILAHLLAGCDAGAVLRECVRQIHRC